MIFDCFTYNGEEEILEIRLNELDALVDYFVIISSKKTFSGKKQKVVNPCLNSKLKKFHKKIKFFEIKDFPESYTNHWAGKWLEASRCFQMEHYQRDYIQTALSELKAKDTDIIIISDTDEIIKSRLIKKILRSKVNQIYHFSMENYQYYLNYKTLVSPTTGGPKLTNFSLVKKYLPQGIRDFSLDECIIIPNSSWHFTNTGNPAKLVQKLKSFSHSEYNKYPFTDKNYISSYINLGLDIFRRPSYDDYTIENIDNLPTFVKKNRKKFAKLLSKKTSMTSVTTDILHNELRKLHHMENMYNPEKTMAEFTFYKNFYDTISNSKTYKYWQIFNRLKEKVYKKTASNQPTYDYYHKNTFWNDHPLVIEYINKHISGNKQKNWMEYFYKKYFKNSLNVNMLSIICGNGWQDRDLHKIFNFKSVDGCDISEGLLAEAEAKKPNNNFHYFKSDLNKDTLPKKNYDLCVNLAGLHHIENMDHAVSEVYKSLKTGGYFVHFEYIGPKRNQFSNQALKYMNTMQLKFPEDLVGRKPIIKPSLEVMLKEDPSEAVGSELIIPTLKKYFKIKELKYFNGGALYMVLYNQIQNFDIHNQQHNKLLLRALAQEDKWTKENKVKPLFAFIVCEKK